MLLTPLKIATPASAPRQERKAPASSVPGARGLTLLAVLCSLVSFGELMGDVPSTTYRSVLIEGVPHVRQKDDFCGEACAAMFLEKLGAAIDQDYVFDQSGLDPIHGRGCYTREVATALNRLGFRVDNVW